MAVVWIVEDEKIHRETARKIVGQCADEFGVALEIVLWDGRKALDADQKSTPPDMVILDLNLSQGVKGLQALRTMPGFEGVDAFHPYVIIWSHFDGELELYEMPSWHDLEFRLHEDRVVRTYWKAETNLKTALKGFLSRLAEEGVYHG